MESSFQKIIAAIVGILIFFVIPVYIAFEKVDDISYSLAVKLTQNFVDNARNKGYISPEMYSEFSAGLYATNNAYDIEIEHIRKRYDPAIYIYHQGSDEKKTVKHILDYAKYIKDYELGKITIKDGANEITYENGENGYSFEKAHTISDEIITDKQITTKLFRDTGITKIEFYRQCLLGNADMYNSLAYMNENSYVMNEGDQINVIVKNRNRTVASIFYSMITANVGLDEVAKIYVNYGGTVRNDGAVIFTAESGSVDSNVGKLFKYSGKATSITLAPGNYSFECWGAAGGGDKGGHGAYAKAEYAVTEETTFYIYVGGAGTKYEEYNEENGGYNGGGNSYNGYGGGGATDIRLISGEYDDPDSLLSRVVVAAGGGGANGDKDGEGGAGGNGSSGANGKTNSGSTDKSYYVGLGASSSKISVGYETDDHGDPIQISEKGSYGQGGSVKLSGAGAGGGGYYGGSAAHNSKAGGGGGLSYVWTETTRVYSGTAWYPLPLVEICEKYSSYLTSLKGYIASGKWNSISNLEGGTVSEIKRGTEYMRDPLTHNGSETMKRKWW